MIKYLTDLAKTYFADSRRWFPSVHEPVMLDETEHLVMHFALGIAGEGGEIANKAKKFLGYGDQAKVSLDTFRQQMSDEIPDVIAYCLDLAATLDIDLDTRLADKRGVCMGRWERSYTWESVPLGHLIPGSGYVVDKTFNGPSLYIHFERPEGEFMSGERWFANHDPAALVPVALTSSGLIYPDPKNVIR